MIEVEEWTSFFSTLNPKQVGVAPNQNGKHGGIFFAQNYYLLK